MLLNETRQYNIQIFCTFDLFCPLLHKDSLLKIVYCIVFLNIVYYIILTKKNIKIIKTIMICLVILLKYR